MCAYSLTIRLPVHSQRPWPRGGHHPGRLVASAGVDRNRTGSSIPEVRNRATQKDRTVVFDPLRRPVQRGSGRVSRHPYMVRTPDRRPDRRIDAAPQGPFSSGNRFRLARTGRTHAKTKDRPDRHCQRRVHSGYRRGKSKHTVTRLIPSGWIDASSFFETIIWFYNTRQLCWTSRFSLRM